MKSHVRAAHIVTITRKHKGKVYYSHLLRRSYRDESGRVKKETLANLSHLPDPIVEAIRTMLKGEKLVPLDKAFESVKTIPHGHVQAVSMTMERLGMAALLSSKDCPERDRVLAMIASRIVAPSTKLHLTSVWHKTTLAEEFRVASADENDLYNAMDWLLERQSAIEKKLCARHLQKHSMVLYDLSSSYFEGETCPLAKLGYSRDGKKGRLQVEYGLTTDARGCPVAISVFEGNVSDSATFMPQIERLRDQLGIEHFVIVGDRGMIGHKAIEQLHQLQGVDWITCLKHASIRTLIEQGLLQRDLFDECNLMEISSPDYPGERLIVCRNPSRAMRSALKREDLLASTERCLEALKKRVDQGTLKGIDKIGVAVGKVVGKFKMAKHFEITIEKSSLNFSRKVQSIASDAALDGLYVVRSSLDEKTMSAADCVRNYKSLSKVERAFRSIKTMDLKVRPIHHRTADRVRAHILLCMLAYYVQWHMFEAWRELTYADTDLQAKATRDPVAPAQRSEAAMAKVKGKKLEDGTPVHSFSALLTEMSTLSRIITRIPGAPPETPTFEINSEATALQLRAFELIQKIQL